MKRLLILAPALLILAGTAAAGQPKVTLCHAAGLDGTTKYITLTVGYPAAYGPGGHFFENGTPRAGHEQDYLGPCAAEPTPTPGVTPTPVPTPSLTPRPTPTTGTVPTPPPPTAQPTLPGTDTE